MKKIVIIFLLLICSGCGVGVGVFHQKEIEYNFTREWKYSVTTLDKEIGYIGKSVNLRDAKAQNVPMILTKDYVLKLWGDPNYKKQKDGYEYWYYKREYSVSGLVLGVLIVNVPILIPSGNHYSIAVFNKDGVLEKIIYQKGGTSEILCGADGSKGLGCFVIQSNYFEG